MNWQACRRNRPWSISEHYLIWKHLVKLRKSFFRIVGIPMEIRTRTSPTQVRSVNTSASVLNNYTVGRFPTAAARGSIPGHVRFVMKNVILGQVFYEYLDFPCQFSFHRLLHTHHLSSGAGKIGQIVAKFLWVGWDWVHLVRRSLFGILYQPWMTDECVAVGGIRIGRANRSTTLSTTNPTRPGLVPGPPMWEAGN
jgi:hypothetical protein